MVDVHARWNIGEAKRHEVLLNVVSKLFIQDHRILLHLPGDVRSRKAHSLATRNDFGLDKNVKAATTLPEEMSFPASGLKVVDPYDRTRS